MHIRQIIIQGFKSYKDQTVMEPFSARHNVIVGRNGSGKSNFFWAIRFVLNDAYTSLSREERQALLHEGSGPASMSAFVEIIFDNADHRFPTGKDEVVLRRTIGLKKDEYSLDKKSATKTEVVNLLESAGFSSANPYYIVPQGRITALCNAKDAERLTLLKEVAGTGVYEARRAESVKILDDTQLKRDKITSLMEFITDRLGELEEEKRELTEYSRLDKDRRCLEYAMYDRELQQVSEELEDLDAKRLAALQDTHADRDAIKDTARDLDAAQRELDDARRRLDIATADRDARAADLDSQARAVTDLELLLADAEAAHQPERRAAIEAELAAVRAEIASLRDQLRATEPDLEARTEQVRDLDRAHADLQARRRALAAKQGRAGQFATAADHTAFLDRETATLRALLDSERAALATADAELAATTAAHADATAAAAALQATFDGAQEAAREMQDKFQEARRTRDRLAHQRKECWREEAKAEATLAAARKHMGELEESLFSSCDKRIAQGIKVLRDLVQAKGIEGVHGPLFELVDVPELFRTAVEVVGGNSIYDVVVQNDEVATRVLEELKRVHGSARVTLMPLNRLRVKHAVYPADPDVVPMLSKLEYDPLFQPAFAQVFGRAVVCSDLEKAAAVARASNLTAVTLDGDRVDRKGALSGGFLDQRKSRLETALAYTRAKATVAAAEAAVADAKAQLGTLEQQITAALGTMQHLEMQMQRQRDDASAVDDWKARRRAADLLDRERAELAARRDQLKKDIHDHEVAVQALDAERATGHAGGLSADERAELASLEAQVAANRTAAQAAARDAAELEARVVSARAQLDNHLLPKEMGVQREALALEQAMGAHNVEVLRADLDSAQDALAAAQAAHREVAESVTQLAAAVDAAVTRIDRLKTTLHDRQRAVEGQELHLSRFLQTRKLLADKRDEAARHIRDLGVLPDDFQKHADTSLDALVRALRSVNDRLKKYAHVNKKAFDQYNNFTKQQDVLVARKRELDESEQSIRNLITSLDRNKDEAIQRTFGQVSANFEQVFEELVPAGRGRLVMMRAPSAAKSQARDDDDEELSDEEEESDEDAMDVDGESPATSASQRQRQRRQRRQQKKKTAAAAKSDVDTYRGVAIQVSFNSKVDEGLHMSQLSGGQKSLVALALIFAIQQCDPAPFYLFDEIDANLDAQYRTAVANKIHTLAENAQFITTTFRAELLAHADKFYGVSFKDKASKIQAISRDDAMGFVELGQDNPAAIQ
ncbi:Structural maintenance of chromosomes protein 3 [Blastocladiella emersonii ATCC 22665]|nr:Structural maintenance of chromosomes protein 3 [Blastocladiella emersonii ATCC 22665]